MIDEAGTPDPKDMIRFIRDDLRRMLKAPGARNIESGEKKIRFYGWILERDDCMKKFQIYSIAKRAGGEEAGFVAAGWSDK